MIPWLLRAGLALVLAAPAAATPLPSPALGEARSTTGGPLLYTEQHRWEEGRHRIDYRDAEGALFANAELHYGDDPAAPSFEQHDLRSGERQGARRMGGRLVLSHDGRERTVAIDGPLVISSGFDPYVRAHWQRLQAGAPLRFGFAVPARLQVVTLQARRLDPAASPIDGPADWLYLQVEPAARLLRWLADPIHLAYDGERRLRVYRGVANLVPPGGAGPVEIRYRYAAGAPGV